MRSAWGAESVLNEATRFKVLSLTADKQATIEATPGFVVVEHDFVVVESAALRKPSILIFVK